MEIEVGGEVISPSHTLDTIEILYVSQGTCKVDSGENSTLLSTGDSITYQADLTHGFRNRGDVVPQGFLTARPGEEANKNSGWGLGARGWRYLL